MKILVIDNSQEELKKACEAVRAAGHEVIKTYSLRSSFQKIQEVDAVITDLFMPLDEEFSKINPQHHYAEYLEDEPAMGILIAIHAIALGKPVAVCTDSSHHCLKASWIYDGYMRYVEHNQPFGWIEGKDWAEAVKYVTAK